MVGENPTSYGILALWAVNGLSIVYWDVYNVFTSLNANRLEWELARIPMVKTDASQKSESSFFQNYLAVIMGTTNGIPRSENT